VRLQALVSAGVGVVPNDFEVPTPTILSVSMTLDVLSNANADSAVRRMRCMPSHAHVFPRLSRFALDMSAYRTPNRSVVHYLLITKTLRQLVVARTLKRPRH
jgi:hypothetical protein